MYCGKFNVIESWVHGPGDRKIDVQIRTSFGFHGELVLGGKVVMEFFEDLPVGRIGICTFCDSFSLDSLSAVVIRGHSDHNIPTDRDYSRI
jgi:hypothetical protein